MKAAHISFALMLAALPAHAEPSVWDVARNPQNRIAYMAFVSAERLRERAEESLGDPRLQSDFTLAALAELELSAAVTWREARLNYLFGDLLLDPDLAVRRTREAERRLRLALAQAPDSPLAAQGLFDLAIACAKLGKRACEEPAYSRALELEVEPDVRSTIFANRAESRMLRGDLKAAIRDYRRATSLAELPHKQALAYWGLGVALERDGNLPAALSAVELAQSIKLPSPPYGASDPLALPGVFFVPGYDIHYYRALGALAEARREPELATKKLALTAAAAELEQYIVRAEPDHPPWLVNARAHRARVERELVRLERELVKIRAARR